MLRCCHSAEQGHYTHYVRHRHPSAHTSIDTAKPSELKSLSRTSYKLEKRETQFWYVMKDFKVNSKYSHKAYMLNYSKQTKKKCCVQYYSPGAHFYDDVYGWKNKAMRQFFLCSFSQKSIMVKLCRSPCNYVSMCKYAVNIKWHKCV